ncbi:phosphotransferase enzyme family protein [Nonomuraea typhae]|uniref:phosphotransferase enzyme family protein n=1 Tax=Nonomuraea typhae TaxID=2603600 RepID=UPI0012F8FDFE|nr:aminoglycoside phosphotransferase family protein [Nonomuraea typhae]
MTTSAGGFTPHDAHRALIAACTDVDLEHRDAEPIRFGENALYRLKSAPIVVRIARNADKLRDVEKEVAVARWLESADFPSVRLLLDYPQAAVYDGRVVTFWKYIESKAPNPDSVDLADILRRLHALAKPANLTLPPLDPLARVSARLDKAVNVGDVDLQFLRNHTKDLYAEYGTLSFVLPEGHIHGDAHKGNLLRFKDGRTIIFDFEMFAFGPREWDLVTGVGMPYEGFRWIDRETYVQASRAYGFDVIEWPGFHTLRRIREITMTTWLMQNVGHSCEIQAEFERRMISLRNNDLPRRWRAF